MSKGLKDKKVWAALIPAIVSLTLAASEWIRADAAEKKYFNLADNYQEFIVNDYMPLIAESKPLDIHDNSFTLGDNSTGVAQGTVEHCYFLIRRYEMWRARNGQ